MSGIAGILSFPRGRASIVLLITSLSLAGCNAHHSSGSPSVQITRVPAASAGGPARLDYIEGKVTSAAPGQQIVLYARSDVWWIQPFANQTFTKVQPDSTWKNETHLGTEYAALLVEPGYRPALKIATLPKAGNGVVALSVAEGKATAPIVAKTIHFSGYDWVVRAAGSDRGGQPNDYDPANAWTDDKGYLHLRMLERNGQWSCAEVWLMHSLGFGTYRFVVQDSAHLPSSAVLGMFTFDDTGADAVHNELDIEISRWGNAKGKNAQYVVQPYYVPENVTRFEAPAGVLSHMFRWEPGNVTFRTFRGSETGRGTRAVNEHVFTSGVPASAGETIHIDLYDYHHSSTSAQPPTEVVIEKFEFLP
jgi:hypothetical protein